MFMVQLVCVIAWTESMHGRNMLFTLLSVFVWKHIVDISVTRFEFFFYCFRRVIVIIGSLNHAIRTV